MRHLVVMITIKAKQIGYPVKRHTFEGKMPANGVQDYKHRHQRIAGIGKSVPACQQHQCSHYDQHGDILSPPHGTVIRRYRADGKHNAIQRQKLQRNGPGLTVSIR